MWCSRRSAVLLAGTLLDRVALFRQRFDFRLCLLLSLERLPLSCLHHSRKALKRRAGRQAKYSNPIHARPTRAQAGSVSSV